MKKIIENTFFIVLIFFLFYLNSLSIPEEAEKILTITFCFLGIAIFLIDSYKTMIKNEYTTSLFIVIANILAIISIVAFGYFAYKTFGESNPDVLHKIGNYILITEFLFVGTLIIRKVLKRQIYKRVE